MDIQSIILFLPVLLVSMTVHEATHAFTSNALGDSTAKHEGRLSLNPLVHIDPVFTVLIPGLLLLIGQSPIMAAKPVPFDPTRVKYGDFGAALVGISGPISNLFMALLVSGLVRVVAIPNQLTADILGMFLTVNISLFVFNMIPWPPLDGSRLLYAFAPEPVRRVMRQIESFGIMGIFVFVLVAFPVIGPVINNIKIALLNKII